jgi:hypothetical protein
VGGGCRKRREVERDAYATSWREEIGAVTSVVRRRLPASVADINDNRPVTYEDEYVSRLPVVEPTTTNASRRDIGSNSTSPIQSSSRSENQLRGCSVLAVVRVLPHTRCRLRAGRSVRLGVTCSSAVHSTSVWRLPRSMDADSSHAGEKRQRSGFETALREAGPPQSRERTGYSRLAHNSAIEKTASR